MKTRTLIAGSLTAAALAGTAAAPAAAVPSGGVQHECLRYHLCIGQYSPAKGNSYYYCRREYISGYTGSGWITNGQTATARFYGKSGQYLFSVGPGQVVDPVNLAPVYSIQVC